MEAVGVVSLQQALAVALARHQRGDLASAESGYLAALALAPEHPHVLHLLSVLRYQRGELGEARQLAVRAVALLPADARFHANLGNILRGMRRGAEAEAAYRAALQRDARLADAYNGLGNLYRDLARLQERVAVLRSGLQAVPGDADLAANLGVALSEAGEHAAAIETLQRAAAMRDGDAEVHYNLGNALAAAGAQGEAVHAFRRSVALAPRFANGWYNLGNALAALGEREEAASSYRAALERAPRLVEAWINLGNCELRLGCFADARAAYEKAAALDAGRAPVHCGLARAQLELGEPAAAASAFERAIALDPAFAPAYAGLAEVLKKAGRFYDAVLACERAIAFDPQLAAAHALKGTALLDHGRADEALASFRCAAALVASFSFRSRIAFAANYVEGLQPAELAAEARAAAALVGGAPVSPRVRGPRSGKARIGLLSGDLRRHSVGYFLLPLLTYLDRGRFEIYCYSTARGGDDMGERFRALAHGWRDSQALDDDSLAAAIAEDGIDLLLDLSGHTDGNRLGVLARRAAPVQASYLGYPTLTGLAAIDYRITDRAVDPEGGEPAGVERPVRLADSYFCYGGPAGVDLEVAPLPALREGRVTFGSFNNLAKLGPSTMRLWARVVARVPGSRLMIKSKALVDENTRADVVRRFEAAGLPAERLALSAWREGTEAHLRAYGEIDVALDSWPYNGATTTCEALWMGVPVVSLCGRTHASRMGLSILGAAGLRDWACRDEEGFVAAAASLAADLHGLADLRSALRERVRSSPLMDAERFARGFAAALEAMLAAAKPA